MEGDPLIRSEQRRRRLAARDLTAKVGLRNAVCVIVGPGFTVGLRFHESDSPVPTLVSKAQGEAAQDMEAEAQALGIPVEEDAELAKKLYEQHAMGEMVRREHFTDVAKVLVRIGAI